MARTKEISPIVTHVGERIAFFIKDKKLKVSHVSHDAGVDEVTLRRYIKGTQVMGIDKLDLIAGALGVEVGELFK